MINFVFKLNPCRRDQGITQRSLQWRILSRFDAHIFLLTKHKHVKMERQIQPDESRTRIF